MSDVLHYEIVSPERLLKDASAASVVVPGADGDFGVLPDHAPMMSTLRPGVIEISEKDGGEVERLFVKGGLAQVSPDGLTILAEEVINIVGYDFAALEKKMQDLREDIEDAKDDQDKMRLEKELVWMQALSDLS